MSDGGPRRERGPVTTGWRTEASPRDRRSGSQSSSSWSALTTRQRQRPMAPGGRRTIARSPTSLMYKGSEPWSPGRWSEKKTSATLASRAISSFRCLESGLMPAKLVLRRRGLPGRSMTLLVERERSRWTDEARSEAADGVAARAESSADCHLCGEKLRLRSEIPWRCRSRRFCGSSRGRLRSGFMTTRHRSDWFAGKGCCGAGRQRHAGPRAL